MVQLSIWSEWYGIWASSLAFPISEDYSLGGIGAICHCLDRQWPPAKPRITVDLTANKTDTRACVMNRLNIEQRGGNPPVSSTLTRTQSAEPWWTLVRLYSRRLALLGFLQQFELMPTGVGSFCVTCHRNQSEPILLECLRRIPKRDSV